MAMYAAWRRDPNLKKVLIVDDEKAFLLSLSEGLATCSDGFCVLTAENGEQALKILRSTNVDLVVTDLIMPVMDGFQFLEQMKRTHPDVPVIVMSAFFNGDVEQRLSSLGVSQLLEKPLDFEDFVKKIGEGSSHNQKGYLDGIPLP